MCSIQAHQEKINDAEAQARLRDPTRKTTLPKQLDTADDLYTVTNRHEDDIIDIEGLNHFEPGTPLTLVLHHADGTSESILANHTYNEQQIEWFKAGSALNLIRKQFGKL